MIYVFKARPHRRWEKPTVLRDTPQPADYGVSCMSFEEQCDCMEVKNAEHNSLYARIGSFDRAWEGHIEIADLYYPQEKTKVFVRIENLGSCLLARLDPCASGERVTAAIVLFPPSRRADFMPGMATAALEPTVGLELAKVITARMIRSFWDHSDGSVAFWIQLEAVEGYQLNTTLYNLLLMTTRAMHWLAAKPLEVLAED